MEEALRASIAARRVTPTVPSRQLVDSIPVHDEEDRKASMKTLNASEGSTATHTTTAPIQPGRGGVTMSLPAILKQNVPGFKARNARLAQLQQSARGSTSDKQDTAHDKARQKLGRRKQRRWENGMLNSCCVASR